MPPSRGLIVSHNAAGRPFDLIDLRRWLRLTRLVHKAEKIDLFLRRDDHLPFDEFLGLAEELHTRLSLRVPCSVAPRDLPALKAHGLHDLFLCPESLHDPFLDLWLTEAAKTGLSVRFQLQAPFDTSSNATAVADRLARGGVVVAHLAAWDPLTRRHPCRSAAQSGANLDFLHRLAYALMERGVEVDIDRFPFCTIDDRLWPNTANSAQLARDHQHYTPACLDLAERLCRLHPLLAKRLLLLLLARHTLHRHPVDDWLLPKLMDWRRTRFAVGLARRLTWGLRVTRAAPPEASRQGYEHALAEHRRRKDHQRTAACRECVLDGICDHLTQDFATVFPGIDMRARAGERPVSPMHFAVRQAKYYDEIDAARSKMPEDFARLAEEVGQRVSQTPPTRRLGPEDYGVEAAYFDRQEGGVKWFSVSNTEKLSTPLARVGPPFTVSVDFGGGLAEYAGFSLGRHIKLVCPMETYRHSVALHVAADGRYVLMRDGKPVMPAQFEGHYIAPVRIAGLLEPRISLWNIEETITTSNVRLWTGERTDAGPSPLIKYSIMIVSTRYTRRLQAVLRAIAHQRGFELRRIEVLIGYVPGVDATEDLVESARAAYPDLRLLLAPFPEDKVTSKGFMINETFHMVSGEWIMLLDSDTILPPDMFARIEAASADAEFIAPDGRKMLPPDVTGKILMGELDPWDHWQELLDGPGEYRPREARGVPVGFCQCFKAKYLRSFPYAELENFEWADMAFGEALQKHVGKEHRLSGTPVLHLDHGGSHWFGVRRHL